MVKSQKKSVDFVLDLGSPTKQSDGQLHLPSSLPIQPDGRLTLPIPRKSDQPKGQLHLSLLHPYSLMTNYTFLSLLHRESRSSPRANYTFPLLHRESLMVNYPYLSLLHQESLMTVYIFPLLHSTSLMSCRHYPHLAMMTRVMFILATLPPTRYMFTNDILCMCM